MGYFPTLNKPLLILAVKVKIWLGHQLTAFSSKVNIEIRTIFLITYYGTFAALGQVITVKPPNSGHPK